MERLAFEKKGRVAFLKMNRSEKRNALDDIAVREMIDCIKEADSDSDVRAIVIEGDGPAFSAGADLDYLLRLSRNTIEANYDDSAEFRRLLLEIYYSRKLTCALVRGPALAGGFGIALACDLIVGSEKARFGFTEVKVGFVPALVLNFAMKKLNEADVRRLVLTGKIVDSTEAIRMGIMAEIIPDHEIENYLDNFLVEFCRGTSRNAVALTKEVLRGVSGLNLPEALRYSTHKNAEARSTEDFQKGVNSFLKKEKPEW